LNKEQMNHLSDMIPRLRLTLLFYFFEFTVTIPTSSS
jgi:hypothetical protein